MRLVNKKNIFTFLGACSLLLGGCTGSRQVTKQKFVTIFDNTYQVNPISTTISGYYKDDSGRLYTTSVKIEAKEHSADESELIRTFSTLTADYSYFIDEAFSFYCGNGFKVKRNSNVVTWDEYKNITRIQWKYMNQSRTETIALAYFVVNYSY